MQDEHVNIYGQDEVLTEEWQRFFPGASSRFGNVVEDFAEFIRAREQHDFTAYDMLIHSLDEVYFRTTEPGRFVEMIHNAWKKLQTIVEDHTKSITLFESFGTGGWWLEDGKETLPLNGHPRDNARRAKFALRRIEQWIKIRLLTPSEQLEALIQTIPVIVWHKVLSTRANSETSAVVSLPLHEHKDFLHVVEALYQQAQNEVINQKKRIAKSIKERLLKSLSRVANADYDYVGSIRRRTGVKNDVYEVERLPRYYTFMKWGDLDIYRRILPTASPSELFWMSLELSLAVRRNWASKICSELVPLNQPDSSGISPSTAEPPLVDSIGTPKSNHKGRIPEVAELRNISLEIVKTVLDDIVDANSSPGEWAAAITALRTKGYLKGGSYAVYRWFEQTNLGGSTSRKSIDNKKDFKEHHDFANRAERRVFMAVCDKLKKV